MKKNIFKIIVLIVATLLIILATTYLIDIYRMKNNKQVLFSTWGYDYTAPETEYPNGDNSNNSNVEEYYFYGKVIKSSLKYIIVEPNEGESIRKSSDKISIGLGENNDMLYMEGTKVKITYSGYIMETYPAQINASKIELVSE